jgi:DNA mismatch repair protein MSH4
MSVYSNSRVSLDSFVPARAGSRCPGRPTTTATSVASQDLICAVSESRGVSSTVGLAFVNLATAEAVLSQICDSQTYVNTIIKIGVFEPSEILFMNTAKESKLRYIIQENLPDPIFTFLDRRCWSEKTGHEYVDRLAFPEEVDSLKVTLGGNYFAACCFAAVGLLQCCFNGATNGNLRFSSMSRLVSNVLSHRIRCVFDLNHPKGR